MFDADAVAAADVTSARVVADLLDRPGAGRGVVVTAPAGAGKSHLIAAVAAAARARGRRVGVAAPTNEQAFGLVRAIAVRLGPPGVVTFVPANGVELPAAVRRLPGVGVARATDANAADLIVGTLSKLGDAFARRYLGPFDLLLIDEAYQADAARYFAVGGLAPVHLLVGDPGQISPFAVVADPGRWRGRAEDPLQTAVGVLRRNHPSTPVHGLPVTRRLDGRAAAVARSFYPDLPFRPAVLPGVRGLDLDAGGDRLDVPLDAVARDGWAYVELPRAAVLPADPEAADLLVRLVRRLFERRPRVRCERQSVAAELVPGRVAVGVSHTDQRDRLRAALDAAGLPGVVVETANKLQGLEFEVVFAWHPLAGLPEADGFHLDPGRLCVLLTRHRQGCVVVGRAGDRDVVDDRPPPATEAFLGWDPDPVLDGWEVHRQVFAALDPFRRSAA